MVVITQNLYIFDELLGMNIKLAHSIIYEEMKIRICLLKEVMKIFMMMHKQLP